MNRPGRIVLSAITIVAILAFLAGYFVGIRSTGQEASPSYEIRQSGYELINPLLECEMAESYELDREIYPFKPLLREAVSQRIAQGQARTIAIYVRDLKNGPWMGVNEKEQFTPASLLKIPLMMAYLKDAERDPSVLKRRIVFHGDDEDITGRQFFKPSKQLEPGKSYSIDDLLHRMLAYSDNNAHRLLAMEKGSNMVFETLGALGIAYAGEQSEDFVSVKNYSALFRVLFNGSYLSHDLSEKALAYMVDSNFREGIRGGVPADIRVASKFGERFDVAKGNSVQLHEFGIVYYPNQPYLIGIVTKGKDFRSLATVIRELSAIVYQELDRQLQSKR